MPLTTSKARVTTTRTSQSHHRDLAIASEEPLQKKFKPLNKSMKDRAEVQLWAFCRRRWRLKKGLKFSILPSTALFSDGSIVTILSEFHRIREYKMLAELLADWEYLQEDGHELFDLVQLLNVGFDVEQEEILKKSLDKHMQRLDKTPTSDT